MYTVEFDAKINDGKINVPVQYRDNFNSDVRVILFNAEYTNTAAKTAEGFGALAHRANPALMEQEDGAWEREAVLKYGDD
jgi:hypothetical protein